MRARSLAIAAALACLGTTLDHRAEAQTSGDSDRPSSPRVGGDAPLEPRPAGDAPQEPRSAGKPPLEPRTNETGPLAPRHDSPTGTPSTPSRVTDVEPWRTLPPSAFGPSLQLPTTAVPGGPGAPAPNGTTPPLPPINAEENPGVPVIPGPRITLTAPAQSSAPLTLDEVLTSVETRYPLLLAEVQNVRAAEGDVLSANGAFDPKWKTKASTFPVGYYRYTTVDSYIEQPLYWRGLTLFGGYRIGQGKFPIYYDGYRTNDLGEARAGVLVPLLRGGSIDQERAKLWKAEAGIIAAKEGLVATKLEFQRSASNKYWEWVAAAKKVDIAKVLLASAVGRNAAIAMRVTRGDAAAVDRTENARAIVQREQQLVSAERSLTTARIALSLYVRDDKGDPVVPAAQRVPSTFPEPTPIDAPRLERDLADALSRRPELRQYAAKRKQYEIERDLARNDAWPELNVMVAGAKQFGDGYPERQPAVLEAGLMLDIPLRTRKADGRAGAAYARFLEYDLELRYAKDKITAEVRDAASGADAASQRLQLARRELELARQLERAERQRFEMGDSNLIFVNLREQSTFDASVREVETLLDHQKALALYRTVIGGR